MALGLAIAWFASAPLRNPVPVRTVNVPAPRLYVTGRVELAPGLTSTRPVLFIIARPAAGGPPVAVKKIDKPAFPVIFTLSVADNMTGTEFMEGDLSVTARLDADGNAGPAEANDLEASTLVTQGSDRTVRLQILPPAL